MQRVRFDKIMKKIIPILLLLILSSCSAMHHKGLDIKPKGELFAYFRITEMAFYGPVERATGFYFYKETTDYGGPFLNYYQYKNGVIVDSSGGGSLSEEVFDDIESIGLKPFDYEKEVKIVEEKVEKSGGFDGYWVTADGDEWEIMIQTSKGKFLMKKWNPGTDFRNYAKYSENIKKLEKYIRRLLMYYAETKIGVVF